MLYLISKERLYKELEHNAKNKGQGVLNWFISKQGKKTIINIVYDVYGVTYIYSSYAEDFTEKDKLIFEIDDNSEILGMSDD